MTTWQKLRNRSMSVTLVALLLLFACSAAFAQTYTGSTAAGTTITNSATVTYTDGNNNSYSKTSAAVTVYVQQIDAFVLTPGTATITGVANQVMQQQFTLTNNANGTEVVALTLPDAANTDLTGVTMYQSNAAGTAPDLTKPIASGASVTLAQGQVLTFWAQGTMASSQAHAGGQFHVYAVDQPASIPNPFGAGSSNWTTPTAYNDNSNLPTSAKLGVSTVTVNLVAGATVQINKSFDQSQGTGGTLHVTFTIQNQGTLDSGTVNLNDVLNGTGFTYKPGTAKFVNTAFSSDTNGTATSSGINATFNYDSTAKSINATFNNIPHSSSQTYAFTFDVTVDAGLAVNSTYTNTARFNYQNNSVYVPAGTTGTTCSTTPASCLTTSTASYLLLQSYGFTFPAAGGVNTIATGTSAQPVYFVEKLTNTGTGNDTYNVSNVLGSFPAGTTFTYYFDNGSGLPGGPLPLVSGTVGQVGAVYSTNAVAAGSTFSYVIAAQLPPNTVGGPYAMTETATGKVGVGGAATATNKTDTDTLTAAKLPLDLLSNLTAGTFATAAGTGAGPEASAQTTSTSLVYPASSYTFELWVNNNQTVADTFKVVASNSTTFSTSDTIPAGWTIAYNLAGGANCSTLGAAVSASGVPVAASGQALVCATVTVPKAQASGTVALYFKAATTGSTGSFDAIHDAVVIGSFHSVTIDSLAQGVQAGAAAIYKNTITNSGNTSETITFVGTFLTHSSSPSSTFGPTLYSDAALSTQVNNSTSITVPANSTVNVWLQVTTSTGDQPGASDVATITITYNSTTVSGTDTTTIVSNIQNISVVKTQAYDPTCSGTWASLTFGAADVKAKPGECVAYRISATNNTGAVIGSVQVNDGISTYVTYCDGTGSTCGAAVLAAKWTNLGGATEQAGTGSVSVPNVISNKLNNVANATSVEFTFEVKVK